MSAIRSLGLEPTNRCPTTQYCQRRPHIPPMRPPPPPPHPADAAAVRALPSVQPSLALAPPNPSVLLPPSPRKAAGRGAGATKFSGSSILHGLNAPFSSLGSTPSRNGISVTSTSECNTRQDPIDMVRSEILNDLCC
jgi:hypothetical protein